MGFFDKLKQGLPRTTQQLVERFDEIVSRADTPDGAHAARSTSTPPRRSKRSC